MKWLPILIVALFTGCGTVRNFTPVWNDDRPTGCQAAIYGGVRTDVAEIKTAVRDLGRFPNSDSPVLANSTTIVCNTVDTPLSLVGDTVTLRYTVPATLTRMVVNSYRERDFWQEREAEATERRLAEARFVHKQRSAPLDSRPEPAYSRSSGMITEGPITP